MKCSVDGCSDQEYKNGYCGICYGRWLINEGMYEHLLQMLPDMAAHVYPEPKQSYYRLWEDENFILNLTTVKRRKAIQDGDKISMKVLFERDRGICQLCGKLVDPVLTDRHPMMKSFDHTVPLNPPRSSGVTPGTHTWGNVNLAHLSCNIRKNNKVNS